MATTEKAKAALIADLLQEIGNPETYSWSAVSRLGSLIPLGGVDKEAGHIVQGIQEYVTRLHSAEIERRNGSRLIASARESSGFRPETVRNLSASGAE